MSDAAIGAKNIINIATTGLTLRSPSSLRPPPNNMPNVPIEEIAPAMVAEIVEIKVSRCFTWASSCAITPRNSRSLKACMIPTVAATAACSGLRPVAKALGCASSMTYTFGMGNCAFSASSFTIL